jgi:hypothetical protein
MPRLGQLRQLIGQVRYLVVSSIERVVPHRTLPFSRAPPHEVRGDYFDYLRQQYLANSAGGGAWPDLAVSTKLARLRAQQGVDKGRRRKGREDVSGMRFPILFITGEAFNSFTPGDANNVSEITPDGFVGGSRVKMLAYHQQRDGGGGRLPKRQTVVPPDDSTLTAMRGGIAAGYRRAVENAMGAR